LRQYKPPFCIEMEANSVREKKIKD
jgi:hypothetical protein